MNTREKRRSGWRDEQLRLDQSTEIRGRPGRHRTQQTWFKNSSHAGQQAKTNRSGSRTFAKEKSNSTKWTRATKNGKRESGFRFEQPNIEPKKNLTYPLTTSQRKCQKNSWMVRNQLQPGRLTRSLSSGLNQNALKRVRSGAYRKVGRF